MSDLELLRAFEPIVRYTDGEPFFPCAVDGFVRRCSLWQRGADGQARQIVPRGELDLERLAAHAHAPAGCSLYLRFVQAPLSAREYQRWRQESGHRRFRAPGRLARVPLLARIVDTGFDISLLVRGRVPGGTAAAAALDYRDLVAEDDRRVYYGRVLRRGGWIVLHYLFFYPMNNWRSGFHGTNDHEADWEQVFVFLYRREDGTPEPRWVAYASHDYSGDDLRRRWDDPTLVREGNHPVVFAGAGSHASYFEPGEYIMGVQPRFLRPVRLAALRLRELWVERLGQGDAATVDRTIATLVSMPFVDYARGDGVSIGPGQDAEWTPIVVSDGMPWVDRYRGLWGLDTRDPFGGERAPSGPKYDRGGSVRLSWYDPLGWSGLDKVLPPPDVPAALERRARELAAEIDALGQEIDADRSAVRRLAIDEEALRATEYFSGMHRRKLRELEAAVARLHAQQRRRNTAIETLAAVRDHRDRVQTGARDSPQAHLRRVHRPEPPAPPHRKVLEFWAAISGAIALLAFAALLVLRPAQWWLAAIGAGVAFGAVEAAARGRLVDFLLSSVLVLGVMTALVLVWEFWRWLVIGTLVGLVALMIRENLQELRS